jgi:hypothetical protein
MIHGQPDGDEEAQTLLMLPEHLGKKSSFPAGFRPGRYGQQEVVEMLRKHKDNPEAVQFIADMMEE